ncbi:diiron oxygenase [Nonomuraea helvata]|uniref:Diiron oxygenase n=1 Tax=Nonomuraea helvata TaxID=37484 RepID=A0ABV5S595_9ACTN
MASTARVPRWQRFTPKLLAVFDDPMVLFVGALAIEEYTDAMQRLVMADEDLQPLAPAGLTDPCDEETRHIKYAHEELKRQVVARSTACTTARPDSG